MKAGLVLSAWVSIDGINTPQITTDYNVGLVDYTAQYPVPPAPNSTVFAILIDDSDEAYILADSNYVVLTEIDGSPAFLPVGENEYWQSIVDDWLAS